MALSEDSEDAMPGKKKNWVLRIVLWGLLTGVVIFGLLFYQVVRKFAVEDEIHAVFYPVANALYRYRSERGIPAAAMDALVPDYLSAIPSNRLVDSVTYHLLPDGQSWELAMHSHALDPPRTYLCRSTQNFTPEEERRIILRYHSVWAVLRD
jgi:hypothetical protein